LQLVNNNEKCHNIFITIQSGTLLLDVNNEQKNNFSDGFKLKPVTTYQLRFVVKILMEDFSINNKRGQR